MGKRAAAPSATAPAKRKRKDASFAPAVACKRRRTPAPAVQASGWASLPTDLALLVACRVLSAGVVDYIAFRAVCSGWRTCTPSPRDPTMRRRQLHPRGWVALCGGDAVRPDAAGEITFFHTRTGRRLRVSLPEIRGYRIVGFTDGLVILLHKRTTAVRVLHPFTRAAVDLPPLACPAYYQVAYNPHAMVQMSAAVCTASRTSIAVVVWFDWALGVLSAEPGHPAWKVLHTDMKLYNALPLGGRLYGVTFGVPNIVQVYPPNSIAPGPIMYYKDDPILNDHYLVEWRGGMVLVMKHGKVKCEGTEPWQCFTFSIFHPYVTVNGCWKMRPLAPSIGDSALFLAKDRCVAVSARDLPSVRRNSVYLSVKGTDHVVLHSLSDRSNERPATFCQVHDTKERIRPSVRPFTIADHLLTYCNHKEWANGLMFHEFKCIPECFEDLKKKIRKQDCQLKIPRPRI